MILSNIYIRPEPMDMTPRVPFNTLKWGQCFKHKHNGAVSQVYFVGPEWITIKREDDWLVRIVSNSEVWNKMVIRL